MMTRLFILISQRLAVSIQFSFNRFYPEYWNFCAKKIKQTKITTSWKKLKFRYHFRIFRLQKIQTMIKFRIDNRLL